MTNIFIDNYLESLPFDISKLIIEKANTPSLDELTSNVYDGVRERYEPVSFSLNEDELYDELEIYCGDARHYRQNVLDSINDNYARLSSQQIDTIYNEHFNNKKNTIDYLNNDNQNYQYDDDYEYDDSCENYVEEAIKMKMYHHFIENYKLVFDQETFEYDEEDGEWGAMTVIKNRMANCENFLMD